MSLTRYNPWSVFDQLQRELNMPMGKFDSEENGNIATANWAPAVDIKEDEGAFILLADIPGVDPDDIEVTMDKGVLTIKGERHSEKKTEEDNYKRVERQYGVFYRRFTLPDSANAEGIEAKSEHGVLTITIPKQEVAQSRRISVTK
ncbi:MAG: Hsp20/alpha crystallin family protein [Gammaproteobacteria bacterium]|nr:Hsp20/alpha crystallin family protein [Gammaproteobacteria bacterium]NNJ98462.1 Hsp20/alpha crystallin family protein [Gammaproteobacteria bacterium]